MTSDDDDFSIEDASEKNCSYIFTGIIGDKQSNWISGMFKILILHYDNNKSTW